MTSLFAWFGEIMQWIIGLVPRIGICRQGYSGVKFRFGSQVREITPGLYTWWPVTTEIYLHPIARQTMNLTIQRLTTADDRTVVISAVIVFEVTDIVAALVDSWDLSDTISDVALLTTASIITSRPYAEIRANLTGTVQQELMRNCQKALAPFGINVLNAGFTDFCAARVISLANEHG